MSTRVTARSVKFTRPFSLEGIEGILGEGWYLIETGEDLLDGLFPVWQRQWTTIRLPPEAGGSNFDRIATIDGGSLDQAMALDAAVDAPAELPIAEQGRVTCR